MIQFIKSLVETASVSFIKSGQMYLYSAYVAFLKAVFRQDYSIISKANIQKTDLIFPGTII